MAASGAKYGIMTSHFYWVGAIPAMVFVGVFMMPFYYGSRARSVPEYLQAALRREDARLQRHHLRGDDRLLLRHLDVRAGQAAASCCWAGTSTPACWSRPSIVLAYIFLGGLTSAIYNEVLQFFLIVLGFLPLVLLGLTRRRRLDGPHGAARAGRDQRAAIAPGAWSHSWAHLGSAEREPDGRRVVRPGDGTGLRAVVRLLVHGLPGRAAGHGGRVDDRGPAHAAHRRRAQDAVPVPGDRARHDRDRAARTSRRRLLLPVEGGRHARTTTWRCR